MALHNVVKHYASTCDMPQCMCEGCEVFIFLKDDQLTTSGLPYIMGTVTAIVNASSGGVDVTVQYSDLLLPLVGDPPAKLEIIFPSASIEGTACNPDCAGECDWITKVKRMLESATENTLLQRHYILFNDEQDVANGSFLLPRIPFLPGMRLSDVRLTCFTYDINTTGTFRLKVGSSVKAQFIGNLAQQRQFTILSADLLNDVLPELTITGLTNGVYGQAAVGLVIELMGIHIPI